MHVRRGYQVVDAEAILPEAGAGCLQLEGAQEGPGVLCDPRWTLREIHPQPSQVVQAVDVVQEGGQSHTQAPSLSQGDGISQHFVGGHPHAPQKAAARWPAVRVGLSLLAITARSNPPARQQVRALSSRSPRLWPTWGSSPKSGASGRK